MQLPKRKPNRLSEYDYATNGAYFLTVCTAGRKNLFWTDPDAPATCPEDVPLSSLGRMAEECIHAIGTHYPDVTVDRFVIMPNHIHLLLRLKNARTPTVSTVIRHMKAAVTRRAGFPLWQKSFYDHVIRGDRDYRDIWLYIEGNPGRWTEDKLYTPAGAR